MTASLTTGKRLIRAHRYAPAAPACYFRRCLTNFPQDCPFSLLTRPQPRSMFGLSTDCVVEDMQMEARRTWEVAPDGSRRDITNEEPRRIGASSPIGVETVPAPSTMAEGRRDRALDQPMMFDGKMLTRRAAVNAWVAAGAMVQTVNGERRLIKPNGGYLSEKQLSKTAMDYAAELICPFCGERNATELVSFTPPTRRIRCTACDAEWDA